MPAIPDHVRARAVTRVRLKGWTHTQAAEEAGVSPQSVRNWVNAAEAAEQAMAQTSQAVAPPSELAPVPPPADRVPESLKGDVCGQCCPPQGVHPAATSFTCEHGHWTFD